MTDNKITTPGSEILFTDEPAIALYNIISHYSQEKLFIIADENTAKYCLPLVNISGWPVAPKILEIASGEENKSLDNCRIIWDFLIDNGAGRNSLLVNLGGGVICDMGGFAASTFKRGLQYVNIPTTLLSQADASIGGKTGINFRQLKNEIGLFVEPRGVIIFTGFLATLSYDELLSGLGEMIKHALIADESYLHELISLNINQPDIDRLNLLIFKSVNIKRAFVNRDPREANRRKALNFGHTFGHAFESFSMIINKPVKHGIAVANGLICELYLSRKKCGFRNDKFTEIIRFISSVYPCIPFNHEDFEILINLMKHDKKNSNQAVNCNLIPDVGQVLTDNLITEAEMTDALEYYYVNYRKQ
ncbi:MAG: 3-dehydroquinate synthase [Bacteroidia bacterium]|nr:3-dehydroquinate synthase [Bacteroidia bacterium]